jgi:hypothetical protein
MGTLFLSAACAMSPAFAAALAQQHSHERDRADETDDTIEMRQGAGRKVDRHKPEFHREEKDSLLHVQLLGINDFHGQLSEGCRMTCRWIWMHYRLHPDPAATLFFHH